MSTQEDDIVARHDSEMLKSAGTTSVYAALDFTELIYEFNTARVP